ncbi:MAG: carbohydrate porin [Zetaproteobacteria bacterium]|nr:carbohydrate porin [Zetaproteobacteria bacterium]
MNITRIKSLGICAAGLLSGSTTFAETNLSGAIELDFVSRAHSYYTTPQAVQDGEKSYSTNSLMWAGDATISFENMSEAAGMMVKTKVDAVANVDGSVGTEDLYVRVGQQDSWDVTMGRFRAWDLYPTGSDCAFDVIDEEEGKLGIYEPNASRGWKNGAIMTQAYFGPATLQLNVMTAPNSVTLGTGDAQTTVTTNMTAVRPAVKVETSGVTFLVGVEQIMDKAKNSQNMSDALPSSTGLGGGLSFGNDMINVGLSFASYSNTTDSEAVLKDTKTSTGFYLTYKNEGIGDIGFGYHMSTHKNGAETAEVSVDNTVLFLSYAKKVFTDGLLLNAGYSIATSVTTADGVDDALAESDGNEFILRFIHNV